MYFKTGNRRKLYGYVYPMLYCRIKILLLRLWRTSQSVDLPVSHIHRERLRIFIRWRHNGTLQQWSLAHRSSQNNKLLPTCLKIIKSGSRVISKQQTFAYVSSRNKKLLLINESSRNKKLLLINESSRNNKLLLMNLL